MKNSQRYQRIRMLVKSLNAQRKKQARQIDILCNDIIQANRGFIHNLEQIAFTAQFAESIIGINDLDRLLYAASGVIKQHFPQINMTFCIKREDNFNLYSFAADNCRLTDAQTIEQYLNNDLISAVIDSQKLCMMDDLLTMGLQINPTVAKQISVAAVPLADSPVVSGFILLYSALENTSIENCLDKLSSITRSLSIALKACCKQLNTKS